MKSIRKRLNIAIDEGSPTLMFQSRSGLLLAIGYRRVVIGGRGPYVEFNPGQIQWSCFHVPKEEEYRGADKRVYYIEYRSNCNSNVKLYFQKRAVAYADYKVGMCYIAPQDLMQVNTTPVFSP